MEANDSQPPYDAVVFDCDSTLCAIEGIEELSIAAGVQTEVRAATELAMNGEGSLESVFSQRLELVRPSTQDMQRVGRRYVESLVPGALELTAALQALGKRVYIVSGGLTPAVMAVAEALDIPAACVHAVDVHYDAAGAYAGFDTDSPLARNGGKPEVLGKIAAEVGRVVMVGDGITDLEARGVCARFVAYAGVEERAAVVAGADRVSRDLDMAGLLVHLTSEEERARLLNLPAHAPFCRRAIA